MYSINDENDEAYRDVIDLNDTIEKQRGKTTKLVDLYKHLNKKYNYNDVVEFNSSSHEQLIQDNLDKVHKKDNLINESTNSKVNDWLANKNNEEQEEPQHKYEHLCDLNADIYDESLQNMFPQLIADTTSMDTVSDIMLDATTLDVTQPVASRHAYIISNNQNIDISSYRSTRRNRFNLQTQYERLVEKNSEPKPRSFSADVVLLNRNQEKDNIGKINKKNEKFRKKNSNLIHFMKKIETETDISVFLPRKIS